MNLDALDALQLLTLFLVVAVVVFCLITLCVALTHGYLHPDSDELPRPPTPPAQAKGETWTPK